MTFFFHPLNTQHKILLGKFDRDSDVGLIVFMLRDTLSRKVVPGLGSERRMTAVCIAL
jgi:hypothetical protein